jgi:hypothetical protein
MTLEETLKGWVTVRVIDALSRKKLMEVPSRSLFCKGNTLIADNKILKAVRVYGNQETGKLVIEAVQRKRF